MNTLNNTKQNNFVQKIYICINAVFQRYDNVHVLYCALNFHQQGEKGTPVHVQGTSWLYLRMPWGSRGQALIGLARY